VLATAEDLGTPELVVRRELRDGDDAAIAELHRRIYVPEYERNDEFVARVLGAVQAAIASGWPRDGGAVWLLERAGELVGSLGLTDEGAGVGRVRWFVFDGSLRGRGLGHSLLEELLEEARAQAMQTLELETFSALTVAAKLYREAGFEVIWERQRDDWGPMITYQHYRLRLR
jgi:ribosomal protein S18 acetylase RimI-like enzyme